MVADAHWVSLSQIALSSWALEPSPAAVPEPVAAFWKHNESGEVLAARRWKDNEGGKDEQDAT
eukprot:2062113-Alexandrium_andersonii.AAC.1